MISAGSNRHVARTGGRQAKSPEWKRARGERVRALRTRLSLTQDAVADRGGFPRAKMSKFESGDNAATTADAQTELADGFGVDREMIARYLDEELDLDEVAHWIEHGTPLHGPKVELESRYSTLRRVLDAKKYQGRWSAPAIGAAQSIQLDADQAPDEGWWVETLDRLDAAIKVSIPKLPRRGESPLEDLDEAPVRPARKKR